MQALRKIGYAYKGEPLKKLKDSPALMSSETSASASGSNSTAVQTLVRHHSFYNYLTIEQMDAAQITPPKRKRKQARDEFNEFLPKGPPDEAANVGSLSFNETLDEKVASFSSRTLTRIDVNCILDPND
jgi:hypothetical protein